MKKKYQNPQMEVITIAPTNLMELSGRLSTDESNRITSSDDFGSRRDSWDDED